MVSGYLLQQYYEYEIFTYGIVLSLFWIAIAPFLIQHAFDHVKKFFLNHKHIFINESDWQNLYFNELRRIQSNKFLFLGIPWGIIASILLFLLKFQEAHFLIQLWGFVSFFTLFFVSSIGFYGVFVLISMMKNIRAVPIDFNPFHPDKFGGISDFGSFSVKGALYFSSGALVFPLVFEIANDLSNGTDILLVLLYILSAMFLIVMISSFLLPVLEVKNLADSEKQKVILESRRKLDSLINDYSELSELNPKKIIEIGMHYYFRHLKLLEVKDYPWDFRVLFEFSLSFLIPIAIAIMQIVFI